MMKLFLVFMLSYHLTGFAQEPLKPLPPSNEQFEELNRKLNILASEIELLKLGNTVVKADKTMYGFGPAASKIYRVNEGISLGGYGEMTYRNASNKNDADARSGVKDQADALRMVLYVGYKVSDKFLINTEIEFEHAGADGKNGDNSTGFAGAEFAYVDYLHDEKFNLRGGLVLIPMGFVNEMHEPTVFLGVLRPDIEQKIIPTTWRENGVGAWGNIGKLSYRGYIVNGFKGENFSASGLRSGRQKGSEATAEDLALVGRVDYQFLAGTVLGFSGYYGGSDQAVEKSGVKANNKTQIYDTHLEVNTHGFQIRYLGIVATNSGAQQLNEVAATPLTGNASIGSRLTGSYLQVGYDVLQGKKNQALIPFVRYSEYNTQDKVPSGYQSNGANDVKKTTIGINYLPHQNIVVKLDYENTQNKTNTGIDQFNMGLGFNF